MNYSIDFNKLIIAGEVVYEAPAEIDDTLISAFNPEAIIVLYDGFRLLPDDYHDITNPRLKNPELQKTINQNVVCINLDGKLIWRIDSTDDRPIDFTHLYSEGASIWAYRRDAEEYRIDPNNGKILEFRMGI